MNEPSFVGSLDSQQSERIPCTDGFGIGFDAVCDVTCQAAAYIPKGFVPCAKGAVGGQHQSGGDYHGVATNTGIESVTRTSQKRKRKVVRKSLGKLFDTAAQDSDEFCIGASSTETHSAASNEYSNSGANSSGISDVEVWNHNVSGGDSRYDVTAGANGVITHQAEQSRLEQGHGDDMGSNEQVVRLVDLLSQTDRGRRMSLLEVKAIMYSIAHDLYAIHADDRVHCQLNLDTVVLRIMDGSGRASIKAGENNHKHIVPFSEVKRLKDVLGVVAGSDYGPPESASCSKHNYIITEMGNMWSFGCLLFALLSGGETPFGPEGIKVCGEATLSSSIDRQQQWLSCYLENEILHVNNSGNTVDEEMMRVVGFDDDSIDLLHSLLRMDPGQRLSPRAVLDHPWFNGVRECLPHSDSVYDHDDASGKGMDNYEYSPSLEQHIFIDPSLLSAMHPYQLIGHFNREVRFQSLGECFRGMAIFAVYNVPGHGSMISAKPIKIKPF